jgi:Septum formation
MSLEATGNPQPAAVPPADTPPPAAAPEASADSAEPGPAEPAADAGTAGASAAAEDDRAEPGEPPEAAGQTGQAGQAGQAEQAGQTGQTGAAGQADRTEEGEQAAEQAEWAEEAALPEDVEPTELVGAAEPVEWAEPVHRRRGFALAALFVVAALVIVGGAIGTVGALTHGFHKPVKVKYHESAVFKLQTGDCVNTPNAQVVSCSTPHQAEVFGTFALPASAWPGTAAVRTAASAGCASRLTGYLNPQLAVSLAQSYVYPDQVAWTAGTRTVICEVQATSGLLTGSVRAAS